MSIASCLCSRRRHAWRRRAVVAVLLPLVAGACHDARHALGDVATASAPKVAIATVASPEPRPLLAQPRAAEALRLPADFPADVFVPDDYRVDSVMDAGAVQVISLRALGRVPGVFADARRAMRAQGWTQTLAMQNAGDSAMLSFEKDSRAAVLSFNPGHGGRDVAMSVQLRRAQ